MVKALDNIPELTLICEYSGEIDSARNHLFTKNDSIMVLLRATSSLNSLVIVPQKYGNLARFLKYNFLKIKNLIFLI
jgi:[histone H3]-lysine27 N-methyltransferase